METIKIRYLDPAEDSNVTENSYLALDLNENDKKNNSEELNPRITVKATVSQISKSIFGGSPPFKRRPDGGVEIGIGDIALDENGNPLVPQPPVVIKQGGAEKIVINDEGIFLKDNTTFEKNVTIKNALNVEGNSTFGKDVTIIGSLGVGVTPQEKFHVNGTVMLDDTNAPVTTTNKLYSVSSVLHWGDNKILALNYDASNDGKVLKIVNGELSWEEDLNPTIPDLSNFIEKNDNISELNNDSGYITASDIPPPAAPYAHPNHSGDVTSVGDGATTITDGAVTNSKIANNAITANKISNNAITENHIAPGSITSDKISNTVVIGGGGGGGSAGFQRGNVMCAPVVVTSPINGKQWVFSATYGGTSTGYQLNQFDIDGTFVRHLLPKTGVANPATQFSWPYGHTSGWAASWPQMWLDGSKGLNSGYAYLWVKHTGSWVFSYKINLTTGDPGEPVYEGVYAGGGNAFGDHWRIVAQDNNNLIMNYGKEDSRVNYANGTQVYVMASGAYNATYKSRLYTGLTRYLPQCSAGLNPWMPAANHNQEYNIICGINPSTGRLYMHRKGGVDVMTVFQIRRADGTGPTRWYRGLYNMLKTAPNQSNAGADGLDYVTQFAIPDAFATQTGIQTTSYQVQFSTPTTGNDAVPLFLTRGGHWASWNYGGSQIIPWNSKWET